MPQHVFTCGDFGKWLSGGLAKLKKGPTKLVSGNILGSGMENVSQSGKSLRKMPSNHFCWRQGGNYE